jgi:hypothetical protein
MHSMENGVVHCRRIQRRCLALFAWLISHQPAVLFSQNKPATSNQPTVLFSQNKLAPAISHQPNEQAEQAESEISNSSLQPQATRELLLALHPMGHG